MTAPSAPGSRAPLRVAVAGVGRFGALHARVWREAGAEIAALVDIDSERCTHVARRFGVNTTGASLDQVLDRTDVDAVVIASDEDTHAPLARAALEFGAHVFVEKPLATSTRDAGTVAAAAVQSQRQVIVGHISRFVPAIARMRAQIAAGAIGPLAALRLRRDFSRAWYADFGSRVDPVWESCIHDIDLAIYLTGAPVVAVTAWRSGSIGESGASVVSAHLHMADGAIATVESAWLMPAAAPRTMSGALELDGTIVSEIEALGLDGVLRQRHPSDTLVEWTTEGVSAPDVTLWPEIGGRVGGALRAEVEHALGVFASTAPNDVIPLQQACWSVAAAEAMQRSLTEGGTVDAATISTEVSA